MDDVTCKEFKQLTRDIHQAKIAKQSIRMGDHNFEQNPISIVSTERELIKRAGKILAEQQSKEVNGRSQLHSTAKKRNEAILNQYTTYNKANVLETSDFQHAYKEAKTQFKRQLQGSFLQLAYHQIVEVTKSLETSKAMERNKNLWALQLLKSLPVQRIVNSFSNKVSSLIP